MFCNDLNLENNIDIYEYYKYVLLTEETRDPIRL